MWIVKRICVLNDGEGNNYPGGIKYMSRGEIKSISS